MSLYFLSFNIFLSFYLSRFSFNINKVVSVDNRGFTYYKLNNLDNRIANVDQLLTTDVDKFCETVTDLYSNVTKPLLDIILYVYRLTVGLGGKVSAQPFLFHLPEKFSTYIYTHT